jgi:dTDP-4-dehydrorhamnose 3,5-epimerase
VIFTETPLEQVLVLSPSVFADDRGSFVKVFNRDMFAARGMQCDWEETFFSTSRKNVLRGFHFQLPPMDMEKIVWVTRGEVLDVLLDLRKGSATCGRTFSAILSEQNSTAIYIPKGVAHAFCVLSENATMVYQTSRVFSPEHDAGILWNSAGFDWPVTDPLISMKDCNLPALADFVSPF